MANKKTQSKSKAQNLQAPKWDLTEIYKNVEDPKIDLDLKNLTAKALDFEKRYKGKIAKLNLAKLLEVFKVYEAMYRNLFFLFSYPEFAFSTNTKDQKSISLMQRLELGLAEIQNHFIFFGLELAKHPKLNLFINDPKAAPYRFMLQKMLINKKHQLKADVESALNLKNITSSNGWVRLYTQTSSQMKVKYQGQEMGMDQAIKHLFSPKRAVRKEVYQILTDKLSKNNSLFSHIYTMLLTDKAQDDKMRKYDSPEQARHDNNGISQKAVDSLINATLKNKGLLNKFYAIRKKLAKIDKVYTYDRYSAIVFGGAKERIYSFPEAVNIIDSAFAEFDPQFSDIFQKLLKAKHIDAAVVPNKRGGAYCAEMPKGHLPYIMMNYDGHERSVQTLAHETGHAIQDILVDKHPITVAHPPLTVAETASVFGEMIVFENLLAKTKSDKEKISLYVSKIDDVFATIFRQISYLVFERKAHGLIKSNGSISADQLNNAWLESQKEIYGNSIEYPKGYQFWWQNILHFYEWPFYVYAYSFGNLLVFALWQEYKLAKAKDKKSGDTKASKAFIRKYKKLLATGGTRSTMETLSQAGFNPEDPQFWQLGFNSLKDLIGALAKLC